VTTTDADGAAVPYIKIPVGAELSTLNWTFLDYLRTSLGQRAGSAAIARDSGTGVFGLMIDMADFERMVRADSALYEDFRWAKPANLIEGYNFGMRQYRGFALVDDPRQMRFRFKKIGAGTNATDEESGQVICTRVLPLRAGRAGTIGNIPEPNPAYYRAEVGLGVIFMNDVIVNLFVPSVTNLGSGMTFGPAPGLTGEWRWINIPDPATNMLGESGFFYGRFQIFPKPLMYSSDTTTFVYRRCPQAWRTVCQADSLSTVTTGAVAVASAAAAGDFSATARTISLTLANGIAAGIGSAVTIKKVDGNSFAAKVADAALPPTYVFAWAVGATNAPTAYTDFTTASTVTVA
jgi:hypothetical protein